jgi:acyl-CoA synthetase (AMP-forming)/AMP-acid ligase II
MFSRQVRAPSSVAVDFSLPDLINPQPRSPLPGARSVSLSGTEPEGALDAPLPRAAPNPPDVAAMIDQDIAVPNPQGWQNAADAIFHNARRRPSHAAIIDGARTITYAELAALVAKTAGHLETIGVQPGEIVGVALGDDADHIVAMLAIAWLGAVILPMDVRWTAQEKHRIAAHFGARLVLVPEGGEPLPGIETVALTQAWRQGVAAHAGDGGFVRRREQPLLLSLSSGTTGAPKGPMVTHGHALSRIFIYTISLTFNEADRFITATPLYFGGARYMTLAYLFMGATVVIYPAPYQAEELAQAVNDKAITSLFLVPTLLRRLLEMPKTALPLFPALRLLISSGSSLYPDERRRIMRELCPNFFNFYSSSEGGGISLLRPEHPDAVSLSVGKVVFGAEVQIIDEQHKEVAPGAIGAIRYRGGAVAESYYRNPEESASAFRDGWYYPGDLGRFDADGFLYLTGRAKDMIIRGGVNVYPAEIEETLIAHPAVAEAAVIGWPSRERGEEIAAFVVCRASASEQELIEHCRRSLAPYKIPKGVFFLDELPKSGLGKVLKPALAERLRGRP